MVIFASLFGLYSFFYQSCTSSTRVPPLTRTKRSCSKTKPPQNASTRVFCGATENRTRDTRIFSPLLYQLSYGTRFFPYLKFGEVPFFSFGITKVGIFSYTPNFSCTFFNIFSKFFRAYTITHYPSGNCPEPLFLTFFCHHLTQKCNPKTTLSNINPNNQK